MPLTSSNCSTLLNRPFFDLQAMIASALAGPTPIRCSASTAALAELMLIRLAV